MRTQTEAIRAARPHAVRGIVSTLLAVAAAVFASLQGQVRDSFEDPATTSERAIAFSGAAVVLLAGIVAVRSFATAVRKGAEAKDAGARGASLGFLLSVVGYVVVVLATLGALSVDLSGLLLGGAVTGVVVGIAAQQTIGNFFAGIVLMAVRPFSVGEYVVMRSGPLGGEYEGTVTDMSLFYVHLLTANGPVSLPNAGVLASAIGPGARAAVDEPKVEMDDEPPA
ncbi:MAG: mechanosensitive ion channel domain-containing protein [Actinomycetota bacterium]